MHEKLEVGQKVWFIEDDKKEVYAPPHLIKNRKVKKVVPCKVISGILKKETSACLLSMIPSFHGSQKIIFKKIEELIFAAEELKQQIKLYKSEGFEISY